MSARTGATTYRVLGSDNLVYGPIDLQTLIQWTADERIVPETWIMKVPDAWIPAAYISDLKPYFDGISTRAKALPILKAAGEVQVEELRQFKLFNGVTNEQLGEFLQFAEYIPCDPNHVLIKKGDMADAVYFLLSGQVRARVLIAHEEKILTTIKAGDFFGEIAMFTQSSRSADIVVTDPSRLLRVSAQSFVSLSQQSPTLICPILFSMSRSLASRVTDLTQQLSRSQAAEHLWS